MTVYILGSYVSTSSLKSFQVQSFIAILQSWANHDRQIMNCQLRMPCHDVPMATNNSNNAHEMKLQRKKFETNNHKRKKPTRRENFLQHSVIRGV